MATQAYERWNARGRPYRLAPWVATAKRQASMHGVRWLGDLGNNAHLQASRPEDHTPFSATAWPVGLQDYVVLAEDFERGPYCDKVLALCRAGDPRVRFVKYMNFGGHHYNVKRGWVQESSSDEHWHISGRSDMTWVDLDPGFDLFVPGARPVPVKGVIDVINVISVDQGNGVTAWYAEVGGLPQGIPDGGRLEHWREIMRATGGRETSVSEGAMTTWLEVQR